MDSIFIRNGPNFDGHLSSRKDEGISWCFDGKQERSEGKNDQRPIKNEVPEVLDTIECAPGWLQTSCWGKSNVVVVVEWQPLPSLVADMPSFLVFYSSTLRPIRTISPAFWLLFIPARCVLKWPDWASHNKDAEWMSRPGQRQTTLFLCSQLCAH